MAVGSGTPYNVHTGTGYTTVFAFSFTLLDAGDLLVTVNGVASSSYTLAGLGAPGGGAVTFSAAPPAGAEVILRRVIDLVRETDYQNNGDLLAPTLNGDFDRLWMAAQQVDSGGGRSIRAPFPEALNELPGIAARANRVLGFDSAGQPVVSIPADGSAAEVVLDLADPGAAKGAQMVAFQAPGGAARTAHDKLGDAACVFDFMNSAQIADVKAGTLALDLTATLQLAIDTTRGRRLYLPKGRYKITAPLVINSVVASSARPFLLFGDGYDANGGNDGTSIHNFSGSTDAIRIMNTGGTDTLIEVQHLGVFGVGATTATAGYGINVHICANARLRGVWVSGHYIGVNFFRSYGGSIEDSYVVNNRLRGIQANEAFNLGNIRRCKCYHNGYVWSQQTANIVLTGGANPNLGTVIENTDFSYAGASIPWFKRADSTLTSIVVASGVATATTAAAHGRTSGDLAFITGATVAPTLNSIYPATLTVTSPTAFTFATAAADGTYTESTLQIAPYACGLVVTDSRGLIVGGYSEDCAGLAAYLGASVDGFEIKGGYWQGVAAGGLILLDNCVNGKIGALNMAGTNAGINVQSTVRPHNVDVQTSCTFSLGSTLTQPAVKLVDGTYYGNAAPTAGTWPAGAYVKRAAPAVGSPKGWYCTVAGTPGTWVSEGNL
jgi:hypothetical protein